MTEYELMDQIKSEEDTLCSLPFEAEYKGRRAQLTRLVNLHRSMLVAVVDSQPGYSGQGAIYKRSRAAETAGFGSSDHGWCASGRSTSDCVGIGDTVRVLVVEREPLVSLLLRLVLENRGYSVREVASRAEAPIEGGRWTPDVIVTDLPRTHAASVQYVDELRGEVGATTCVIIGTAPSIPHVRGVDVLFVRPFEAEEIAERISCLTRE